MSIGEKIKYFRNKLNLTQQELANSADISLRALSNYEKGIRTPSLEMLIKISRALGVDIKDLDPTVTLWEEFKTQPITSTSSIGENIKKFRLSKEMTREDLARLLEIAPTSLQNYELNSRKPNIDMLIKLSNILNVSIDELILGESETSDLKEFINNFEDDFLDISNRNNIIYDKGFLDGLKKALQIIEGEE